MILESKRIRLRFFDKYDKNDLIILLNDEDVSKWMDNVPYPYLEKHADWWIEIGSKKKYQFAITKKKSKILIGSLKITLNGEIGCWIGKDYWNKGYATEAVELIKIFGFENLNLNKLWAATHEENIAPINVLNVTGFSRVENKPYYVEGVGNTRVRPHFELLNRP